MVKAYREMVSASTVHETAIATEKQNSPNFACHNAHLHDTLLSTASFPSQVTNLQATPHQIE